MRSQLVVLAATFALLTPTWSAAQPTGSAAQPARTVFDTFTVTSDQDRPTRAVATTAKGDTYTVMVDQDKPAVKPVVGVAIEPPAGRWVRALTNVQVELTITDQAGTGTPEKKTVSMVVSSGSWGKIRSVQYVREAGRDQAIDLNVDARPFVSVEGPIQLELTIVYSPPGTQTGDVVRLRPTGVNQSLTVILQSGKPLTISQAADPIGDRKIIVEAKATVLK
jgi:hypothetical protein